MDNIDKQEVKKFSELAENWWNKDGDFKPLHIINPLRADYIKSKVELTDKNILDVGCGGGLLTEALFDHGAVVTGIDAAGPGIEVAKIHAKENSKNIEYGKMLVWRVWRVRMLTALGVLCKQISGRFGVLERMLRD